jgi:hypothetical protein
VIEAVLVAICVAVIIYVSWVFVEAGRHEDDDQ